MLRRSINRALLFLGFASVLQASSLSPRELGRRIDETISRKPFDRAIWGVLVSDDAGATIYARNERLLFIPASVRKLFAAATIASCSGLEWHIATGIEVTGEIHDGILSGDLVIRGMGDPSLGGRHYDDRDASLEPILAALHEKNVATVRGSIVADATFFAREPLPGAWKHDNIGESWAAAPSAVNYNENVLGVFVAPGSCTSPSLTIDPWFPRAQSEIRCEGGELDVEVDRENNVTVGGAQSSEVNATQTELAAAGDPALFAAQAVRAYLILNGIFVEGEARVAAEAAVTGAIQIGAMRSPPLSTLVGTMLEDSSNLYAEVLLQRLSANEGVPARRAASLEIERTFLRDEVGADLGGVSFEDGSGLSVEDLVAPEAVMSVVQWMSHPSRRSVWEELLPTPGEGTLRRRLPELRGRLWAKTGTLDGVNGLAGWLITSSGETRRFVILLNHHVQPARTATDRMDEIVRMLAD